VTRFESRNSFWECGSTTRILEESWLIPFRSHYRAITGALSGIFFTTLFIYFRRHIGVKPEKRRSETVSSLPQKPTADLKSVKSLLEKHTPAEAYEILAAQT